MNIIIIFQTAAALLMLAVLVVCTSFAVRNLRLLKLYKRDYVRTINMRTAHKLYPFVPKRESSKYKNTRKFLTSVGWNISVEGIYLLKWFMFAAAFFMMVTIQTTNVGIQLKEIIENVNYNHNVIETARDNTQHNIDLEKQLFNLADKRLEGDRKILDKQNMQAYIEFLENLIVQQGIEVSDSIRSTAQRLYYKVLHARNIRYNITPYIYILLFSSLIYYLPDILGQIKKKLIEDKKNWEILNCMIVFSIFGRMPPYSVQNILEHMAVVTEVYKPLLEALIENLKKGGEQEEAFDAALEAVDREELYELIETMKLAKKTGLVNSLDDVEENIANTIKWIEIENITRRRIKMLYAMSAAAVVMALGCIYFAYGLTVISNPANMILK